MKKILSLILAALMVVSCAAFVSADAANGEVYDVQSFAIQFLADHGIFKGVSSDPDVVDPDAATLIRRYQMALFVSRIATGFVDDRDWENGNENVTSFTDLTTEPVNKYLGAISFANQQGIIEGRNETTFDPYGAITYREALAMLVRSLGYKGLSYPWGVIQKAVELGLTEDIDGVAYTDRVTRGQVAIMVYNALFAQTAAGTTLGQTNFDAEYGWENILIVSSDKFSIVDKENKAKTGFVGFQVLNADGTLGGKTYYVAAAELGLTGHADELAVGAAYLAMFKIENNDFASMNYYYSLADGYVMNIGITDNTGAKVGTQPIKAYMDGIKYTFVSAYSTKDNGFLSVIPSNEIITFVESSYKAVPAGEGQIAVDIATGNVYELIDGVYTLAWTYSEKDHMYYQASVDAATGKLYYKQATVLQLQEWYKSQIEDVTVVNGSVKKLTDAQLKAPYAKLSVYDLNADGYADRANYKEYKIGHFSVSSKKHNDTCGTVPHYTITTIDGTSKTTYCSACQAFLNIDSSVRGFDGTKPDRVMYNYNEKSGELEIVKAISGGMDYDSGYVAGLVTAYSVIDGTITINGNSYPVGYAGIGDGFQFTKSAKGDLASALILANYQMQYVNALVVDGQVIQLSTQGAEQGNWIMSLGYAGITADGYLSVYGYSTFAGFGIYELDTINGWKRGDAQYYLFNSAEVFAKGTFLTIRSQGEAGYSVDTTTYDAIAAKGSAFSVSFVDGYRSVNGGDLKPATAAQTYIIIAADGTIYTKQGILTEEYTITGAKAVASGDTYYIYEVAGTQISDAFKSEQTHIGFVKYEGKGILNMTYGDNYLLGSTESTVQVLNMLTGKEEAVAALANLTVKKGAYYMTVDGKIVAELENVTDANILAEIQKVYKDSDYNTAKYAVLDATVTADIITLGSNGKLSAASEKAADLFWAGEFDLLDDITDANLKQIFATAKIGTLKKVFGTVADGDVTIILNRADNNYVVYVH